MSTQRNFAEERDQAQREAEQITTFLHNSGYDVGPIDWGRAGRLAYVPVNGVEVGDLLTLSGSSGRGHLLEDVRYKLLEAIAQEVLQEQASAASWTPLEVPSGAPAEIQSLWRIHLGEDDARPGVNIAEVLRDGKREFVSYAGGPQPGYHSFPVDKISVRAIHLIKEQGGTVTYDPGAQRADTVTGRRRVTLPEGTRQESEGDKPMAPQRFVLPDGQELRLVPHWYTVELFVAGEQ
jgi:hypothetical protein